jgi:GNAT superfamily N-acetyltransferase
MGEDRLAYNVQMQSRIVEHRRGEFVISTNPSRLDLDVIHGFLTNCYWAKGIPRDVVARSIEHSLCFGVYDGSGNFPSSRKEHKKDGATPTRCGFQQVGFARVISDFATIAYLGDVFMLESHRGRGLSKWMMECIMQHPALQGLRRWILLTRDAHGLYSRFGFTPLRAPDRYMELHNADVYEARKTL